LDELKHDKRRFLRSLPRSSAFKLAFAVFFTFASVGFINDLFHPRSSPFYSVLAWSVYDGLGALAFLLVNMQPRRWIVALVPIAIAATIPLMMLVLPSFASPSPVPGDVQRRLILDAVFILVLINTGYVLFLVFIENEGVKHLRIQTELDLAERLQTTLVPAVSLRTAYVEVEARSIPSSQMGGDLADALACDGFVTCYVADVSGHGIAAGVLMGMVKTAVRMALLRGEALDGTLRALQAVLPGVKEPSSYVTFAGLRFDGSGSAEYTTAAHVPILHHRQDSHTIERLFIEQFPVGIIPGAEYRAARAACSTEDVFVMLTDGIVEVTNEGDEEFGLERVERLLLENSARPLAEIAERIIGAATSHGRQIDDQTILIARISGLRG
jgi:serine phosphatase RsbU (regulator of sigma subunit)